MVVLATPPEGECLSVGRGVEERGGERRRKENPNAPTALMPPRITTSRQSQHQDSHNIKTVTPSGQSQHQTGPRQTRRSFILVCLARYRMAQAEPAQTGRFFILVCLAHYRIAQAGPRRTGRSFILVCLAYYRMAQAGSRQTRRSLFSFFSRTTEWPKRRRNCQTSRSFVPVCLGPALYEV